MNTEQIADTAASGQSELTDGLGPDATPEELLAEICRLHAAANRSERRAIAFGDIVQQQVIAMQAAVIEGHLQTPAQGLQWIVNTLAGPGNLPDLEEAKAIGGAQAWWDRETANHEEFRTAHPGPNAELSRAHDELK